MPRAKRGFKARRRRNRVLKLAKGYHSARSRLFAYAKEVVMKSWVYAYAHRKRRKRDFRRLWIARINAGARHYVTKPFSIADVVAKVGAMTKKGT